MKKLKIYVEGVEYVGAKWGLVSVITAGVPPPIAIGVGFPDGPVVYMKSPQPLAGCFFFPRYGLPTATANCGLRITELNDLILKVVLTICEPILCWVLG